MFKITKLVVAATFAVVLAATVGGTAQASDPPCPPNYVLKKVTVCETVTVSETKCVPYQVCVTRYDQCGNPYPVQETRYREVEVPVQRKVSVTKYVRVPAY